LFAQKRTKSLNTTKEASCSCGARWMRHDRCGHGTKMCSAGDDSDRVKLACQHRTITIISGDNGTLTHCRRGAAGAGLPCHETTDMETATGGDDTIKQVRSNNTILGGMGRCDHHGKQYGWWGG